MRILGWSDLHADYEENRKIIASLSELEHRDDVLLLAGDVSHRLDTVAEVLDELRRRFRRVLFVPGNHDLWTDGSGDSRSKLTRLEEVARSAGVDVEPVEIDQATTGGIALWLVPMLSWYVLPEEGEGSLFVEIEAKDAGLAGWVDRRRIRWPGERSMCRDLRARNERRMPEIGADSRVVTFSHFLPRRGLLRPSAEELAEMQPRLLELPKSVPRFNFSRVAGDRALDRQVRRLGASIHLYGHQHRNRHRVIDGVEYFAHSLGYPRERAAGFLPADSRAPRVLWPS